jgi:hypothetical protein
MILIRTEHECIIRRENGVIVELWADVTPPPEPNYQVRFIDWPGDPMTGGVQVTWLIPEEGDRASQPV